MMKLGLLSLSDENAFFVLYAEGLTVLQWFESVNICLFREIHFRNYTPQYTCRPPEVALISDLIIEMCRAK